MGEKELNSIIANNISKYLEMQSKTQSDLAEYMGVSQATVSNWCKGIKMPRMTKIDMICDFFSIKRYDLMNSASTIAHFSLSHLTHHKQFSHNRLTKPFLLHFYLKILKLCL